jgi:glycine hydroxymethyltransferase
MLDWRDYGRDYTTEMIALSKALSNALDAAGVPVFLGKQGFTNSHQFAIMAAPFGGGQTASKTLRQGGFLACGIGLPRPPVDGDMNGLRIGTPELVRWGMTTDHADQLADLIMQAIKGAPVQNEVSQWRRSFNTLKFIHS